MTHNPIILELIMWGAAILLSLPAIWWAFSLVGEFLGRIIFPKKHITIIVIENDVETTQTVSLEDTDALVDAILNMKGKHNA